MKWQTRYIGGSLLSVVGLFTAFAFISRSLAPLMLLDAIALWIIPLACRIYYRMPFKEVPNTWIRSLYRLLWLLGLVYLVTKYGLFAMIYSPCLGLLVLGAASWPVVAKARKYTGRR